MTASPRGRSMRDDGTNPGQGPAPNVDALVREVLVRVADRWTLLVLEALAGERELRFARLRERLDGVSQKMLTKTLRALERDGLVTRRVHATVPPRVDYKLTPLGEGLGASLCGLWTWAEAHVDEIERARRAFDEAGDADAAG